MNFIKIKIISFSFFIIFALFLFLSFRNYIIEIQSSGVDINIINTKQYIKKSIDFLINETKQRYINSSNIIFSDDQIIKALENKDRENFYQYAKNYYERLKQRDNNFWGLHIILPDNMSFIRVHKPHVADRLIVKGKKPLIDKVNETYQQVVSFDAGKFGYFLRVVSPVFSKQKKYLGAAEFSISVDSLTQYIKGQLGYEALFLVKNTHNKNFLNNLPKTQNGLALFKSTDEKLFKHYSVETHKDNFIDYKNKSFNTIEIKLSDTASILVAFDITNVLKEQQLFKKNVTSLISFVIFIFFIIWFFATQLFLNNKKQLASLQNISITDSLCGIYNRRHFDHIFPKIINVSKRKNELFCFIILDLDYFKQYNDTYGHQMGDEVIKSTAKSIKESLHRADDYCFRLGGEEFAVIFKVENKQAALDFANIIRINIENLKIVHGSSTVSRYVTASLGIMCKNAMNIKNVDEIYKEADDLLYKAKNSGRNKVVINI